MKIEYRKTFLKELSQIPPAQRNSIEKFVFEYAPGLKSIFDSRKVEAMHGFPTYFKVRFGSYRIGLRVVEDKIIFERVLHRKDIYRYFP